MEGKDIVSIDGSHMEGGGQIIRTAVGLSALTSRPVEISNIRAGRPRPGLMAQHLEGIKAAAQLTGGRLEGGVLGSTKISFYPGDRMADRVSISIGTAGSLGLIFQIMSIPACRAEQETVVSISGGGTWGKWAPPLLYIKYVLLNVLSKMGYRAGIRIIKDGFYPAGGAKAEITFYACKGLKPLVMEKTGEIKHIGGMSVASTGLQNYRIAEKQAREAEKTLKASGFSALVKEMYVKSDSPGSGIILYASDGNNIIGSDSVGERGKSGEAAGREAASGLLKTLASGASADAHLSDQLLPFMAICSESKITAPEITGHARTNMWVIEKFLPVKFRIDSGSIPVSISCAPKE